MISQISIIKKVITDNDTVDEIVNKFIAEQPERLSKKVNQFNDEKKALNQIKAQISSIMGTNEGIFFNINRDSKPYTYSLIEQSDNEIIDTLTDIIETNVSPEDIKVHTKKNRVQIPVNTKMMVSGRAANHCESCHIDLVYKDQSIGQIHHKDNDPSNNSLDNLIYLCPNCHEMTKIDNNYE